MTVLWRGSDQAVAWDVLKRIVGSWFGLTNFPHTQSFKSIDVQISIYVPGSIPEMYPDYVRLEAVPDDADPLNDRVKVTAWYNRGARAPSQYHTCSSHVLRTVLFISGSAMEASIVGIYGVVRGTVRPLTRQRIAPLLNYQQEALPNWMRGTNSINRNLPPAPDPVAEYLNRSVSRTGRNHYQNWRGSVLDGARSRETAARQQLSLEDWLRLQDLNRAVSMTGLKADREDLKDLITQNYPSTPSDALYITSNVAGDKIHGVYEPESLYTALVGSSKVSPLTRVPIRGIRRVPSDIARQIAAYKNRRNTSQRPHNSKRRRLDSQ